MEFLEKIKRIRKAKKMTRNELAETLGISINTLHKYELGQRSPNEGQKLQYAEALNISPLYFSDVKIQSPADMFIIIAQLLQQSNVNVTYKKDRGGKIKPGSIAFSFKNKEVNEKLIAYLGLIEEKKDFENTSAKCASGDFEKKEEELAQKIQDTYDLLVQNNNVSIDDLREVANRPPKPENVYEMEKLLIDCSPHTVDLLVDMTKLIKKYNNTIEKESAAEL